MLLSQVSCQSRVKQKLMFAYCYSLYGSVLWDLNNRHTENVLYRMAQGFALSLVFAIRHP